MRTAIINEFTQFQLSDKEQVAGQILNDNNIAVLQNLRAQYSLEKLKLVYTPETHQQYLQREAEIMGWLNCLTYILDQHDTSVADYLHQASNSESSQSSADNSSPFE